MNEKLGSTQRLGRAQRDQGRHVDVFSRRPRSAVALDSMIERVAFDGNPSGLGDQAPDLGDGRFLGRLGARFVVDLFVDHGPVEIVGPEGQGDLRRLEPEHDPVRLDVRKVVEHQPADGHDLEVHEARRLGDVGHLGVVGMERQRDERLKPAGLVLQLAQPDQWSIRCLGPSIWP